MSGTDVLADLRGVVRISKAASVGVPGNTPRIERAEKAIAAIAELIEAFEPLPSPMHAQVATFEGADYVLISPEDYEALFTALSRVTRGAE